MIFFNRKVNFVMKSKMMFTAKWTFFKLLHSDENSSNSSSLLVSLFIIFFNNVKEIQKMLIIIHALFDKKKKMIIRQGPDSHHFIRRFCIRFTILCGKIWYNIHGSNSENRVLESLCYTFPFFFWWHDLYKPRRRKPRK